MKDADILTALKSWVEADAIAAPRDDTMAAFLQRLAAWVDHRRLVSPRFWHTFRRKGPPKGGKDDAALAAMRARLATNQLHQAKKFAGAHTKAIRSHGHSLAKATVLPDLVQRLLALHVRYLPDPSHGSEVHWQMHRGRGARILSVLMPECVANAKAVAAEIGDSTRSLVVLSADQVHADATKQRWSRTKLQQQLAHHAEMRSVFAALQAALQEAAGLPDAPNCLEFMMSCPGQEWQLWHQDGVSRALLTGIVYLQGGNPTIVTVTLTVTLTNGIRTHEWSFSAGCAGCSAGCSAVCSVVCSA